MPHPQSSWPFERPEQLADLLSEQGVTPEERADLLPVLRRLSEWQAPQPEPADTRRLLARLTPELPALSPVRQAIREHRQHRIVCRLRHLHRCTADRGRFQSTAVPDRDFLPSAAWSFHWLGAL